uniref:DUF4378 domain-containing protein n=1 Tax=Kalanchoe fedtschenkoi TaxID=63787 RepID=A0A7N0U9Y5_KALFE
MSSQLHDLLQQDQEPFHLRDYIADRRTKLRTPSTRHQQQLTTNGGKSSTNHFSVTFCKNTCFSGKHDSPDLTRASPVLHFPKRPVKLLHIPSRTAALLLEAALRIHKSSPAKHVQRSRHDFGFIGSVLKMLSFKTQKRNDRRLETGGVHPPGKNVFQREASRESASGSGNTRPELMGSEAAPSDSDMEFCDAETSSSSSNSDATRFCENQQPGFSFLPPSPSRRTAKDEYEKEQCSPICVLDPLFQYEDDANDDESDRYGLQCSSYATLQRKQRQLLQKLRRLAALAELDPKALEQIILRDEHERDLERLEESDDVASEVSSVSGDEFLLRQVLEKFGFHDPRRIPVDLKRLVSDLIAEEEEMSSESFDLVSTVCARLESWRDVEPNTIAMMVDRDFKQESRGWESNHGQAPEVATEVDDAIFGSLVEELIRELSQ